MLAKIKNLRLQVAFVNPGFPAGRPQHYPTWEESIDLYDLRDSALSLVHMLRKRNSLQSLSLVLVAQNTAQSWTSDQQYKILKTIIEPLEQLRTIPKVNLIGVCQIHFTHRLSYTQYFLDCMRPATSGDTVAKPGEFILSYKYSGQKMPTSIRVTKPFLKYDDFVALKSQFESIISSNTPCAETPQTAHAAFASFRKAYHAVEGQFRTVLPRGKNWLLHKARICRERGDAEGIAQVRQDLEEEVRRIVAAERDNIDLKERTAMEALRGFDEERDPSRKRKREVEDEGHEVEDDGDEDEDEGDEVEDEGDEVEDEDDEVEGEQPAD
jgi:hypothetical protein